VNYEAQKVEFNHSGESLGGAEKVAGFCPELNYFNTPCHLVFTLSFGFRVHHYRKSYTMGSVVLPHLVTGWHVDQAIMSEEERLVVIRFGRDWDADCMRQDEVLYSKWPITFIQLLDTA